ncbi:MAG: hypothetical protein HYT70_02545 [Candidatus Aenigmarchaeota archaeon]|nr:hypothetical protein [Candidatus Aenigmarchaeota archaeon]
MRFEFSLFIFVIILLSGCSSLQENALPSPDNATQGNAESIESTVIRQPSPSTVQPDIQEKVETNITTVENATQNQTRETQTFQVNVVQGIGVRESA